MTNQSICKAFVEGAIKEQANSMFIEGNVIYSYGYHFPLAVRFNGKVYVNEIKFSKTTSKHQSAIKKALNYKYEASNTEELKKMI